MSAGTERNRITELFDAAIGMDSPQRGEFLVQACAGDEALLAELKSLVAEHEQLGDSSSSAAAVFNSSSQEKTIQRLGEYEIRFEIGRGGFGRVYLGFDPRVQRQVAIKVMSGDAEENMVHRFRTEAAAAGNLDHENIVTVYGYGEDQGSHYLVMEYLKGQDLQQVIKSKQALTLLQKVNIMSQVAEGLRCAHLNGVVHRDVKPANIMLLTDGKVKIMDFGIARVQRDEGARLTQHGFMVGTVSYMAPEQLTGSEADALCDIWAYGVIYYELLTGQHPFHAVDLGPIMYKITSTTPPPASSLCQECPPALERVIARLLSKDRDHRYQSFEDVQFDILPVLRELRGRQAAAVLDEAVLLLRAQRLDEANAKMRECLDLDSGNDEARRIREVVQEQMRQRTLRPRIAALVRQAEIEAERRSYANAMRSIDSALRLAPSDSKVRDYREKVEAEWRRVEQAVQLTEKARQHLELEDLSGALEIANSALVADRGSPEAAELLAQVRTEIQVREQRRRFRDSLNQAEVLLAISALHDADVLLKRLAKENPGSTEVQQLVTRLGQQKEEEERQQRLRSEVSACQALLRDGEMERAIQRLDGLAREFPAMDQPREMLAFAKAELRAREAAQACEKIGREAWQLVEQKEFGQALMVLEHGLLAYPNEARLLELKGAIASSREEHEKARVLEDQIARCREIRKEGRLDEACALLETLRSGYVNSEAWRSEHQVLLQLIRERDRERVIRHALEKGKDLLEGGQPDSTIQLLEGTIATLGHEPRLDELLGRAVAVQAEIERHKDVGTRASRAAEYEKAGEWDAALALLQQGLDLHGPEPELQTIAERLVQRKNLRDLQQKIELGIQRRDWDDASLSLEGAAAAHPEEPIWNELAEQVRAGRLKQEIERNLAQGDLDVARQQLEEARRSKARLTRVDILESELERAEVRRSSLARAKELTAASDHKQAEAVLSEQLQRHGNDPEVVSLLGIVRQQREEQDRDARLQEGRAQVQRLVQEHNFDEAIRILKGLLKEFRSDLSLEEDLQKAKAAQQSAEKEKQYQKGRSESQQLANQGEPEAAVRRLRKLLKQFPADAAIEQDLAAATLAWEAQKRQRVRLEAGEKAQNLIQERKFDAALQLLRPLLKDQPQDPGLQQLWRSAIAGKEASYDWLLWHEQATELEELYKKGKALAVKERAERLLEQKEEPRVRQLLSWAETALATPGPRTRSLPIPSRGVLVAISAGMVVFLGLILWLFMKPGANPPVTLKVNPTQLRFEMTIGGSDPAPMIVSVTSSDPRAPWSVTGNQGWILAVKQGATAAVSVNPAGLGTGSYAGVLEVEGTEKGTRKVVGVTLVIEAPHGMPPASPR